MLSPEPGAQPPPPSLPAAGRGIMVPRSPKREQRNTREEVRPGLPKVTELVGGRAGLIIVPTPVVLRMEELEVGAAPVLGGSERWAVVLMQLAAPQEPPSPPPLLPGTFSHPEPLASLHLLICQDSGCPSLPLLPGGAGCGPPKAGCMDSGEMTSQGVFPCRAPTIRPLREILDNQASSTTCQKGDLGLASGAGRVGLAQSHPKGRGPGLRACGPEWQLQLPRCK